MGMSNFESAAGHCLHLRLIDFTFLISTTPTLHHSILLLHKTTMANCNSSIPEPMQFGDPNYYLDNHGIFIQDLIEIQRHGGLTRYLTAVRQETELRSSDTSFSTTSK